VTTDEGAAFGAALLAATGAGRWPDIPAACAAAVRIAGTTAPSTAAREYEDLHRRWRRIYPALKPPPR